MGNNSRKASILYEQTVRKTVAPTTSPQPKRKPPLPDNFAQLTPIQIYELYTKERERVLQQTFKIRFVMEKTLLQLNSLGIYDDVTTRSIVCCCRLLSDIYSRSNLNSDLTPTIILECIVKHANNDDILVEFVNLYMSISHVASSHTSTHVNIINNAISRLSPQNQLADRNLRIFIQFLKKHLTQDGTQLESVQSIVKVPHTIYIHEPEHVLTYLLTIKRSSKEHEVVTIIKDYLIQILDQTNDNNLCPLVVECFNSDDAIELLVTRGLITYRFDGSMSLSFIRKCSNFVVSYGTKESWCASSHLSIMGLVEIFLSGLQNVPLPLHKGDIDGETIINCCTILRRFIDYELLTLKEMRFVASVVIETLHRIVKHSQTPKESAFDLLDSSVSILHCSASSEAVLYYTLNCSKLIKIVKKSNSFDNSLLHLSHTLVLCSKHPVTLQMLRRENELEDELRQLMDTHYDNIDVIVACKYVRERLGSTLTIDMRYFSDVIVISFPKNKVSNE